MNDMYCPCCGEKLISNGTFQYEDCCESVIYSDKNQCSNEDCIMFDYKCVWSNDGLFFSMDMRYRRTDLIFPDDNYSALNSFSKRMEVEIYKKGLKKKTYLSHWLCLGLLKPYIEYNYKGDDWGNVLKRSFKIEFLKKDSDRNEYCIHYTSGIHMLIYVIKVFLRNKKLFSKRPTKYNVKEILESFDRPKWDNRWYKKTSLFIFNTFFKRLEKECIKYKEIFDIIGDFEIDTMKKMGHDYETILSYIKSKNKEELIELRKTLNM